MKIHEYNEMMRWLTRPAGPDPRSMPQEPRIADREPYYMGGRVGYQVGALVQAPKIGAQITKAGNYLKAHFEQRRTSGNK